MTLRARLTLVIAATVVAAVAMVTVVVFYAERAGLQLLIDDELRTMSETVAGDVLSTGEVADDVLAGQLGAAAPAAQVVTQAGRVVPLVESGPELPVDSRVRAVAEGTSDRFYRTTQVDGEPYRILTVPLPGGSLQVGRSLGGLEQITTNIGLLLVMVTMGAVSLAVVLGWLSARTALRPVRRLSAAAETIAKTLDLRRPLEVRTRDELGRLAESLNTMLAALDVSRQSQQRLVADASHELRTPLATMLTNIEVLELADRLSPAERARIVADVRTEMQGLIATVRDLLDLARAHGPQGQRDQVDLRNLVARAVADAQRRAPQVRFTTELTPVTVRADAQLVTHAVANLLDNAAKWSPRHQPVEVALTGHALTVRDHGPGIDREDLERIFERFYRASAARGTPGSGLGLSITRAVVEDHGWRVTAENAAGGGSRFRIVHHPTSSPPLTDLSTGSHGAATSSADAANVDGTSRTASRFRPSRSLLVIAAIVPLATAVAAPALTRDGPTQLMTLTGTLVACGERLCVGEDSVDFGPDWYLLEATSRYDYDGDGATGRLQDDLDGLIGTDVTLETDGGETDADVYAINGLPFRFGDGQLPPPRRDRPAAAADRAPETTAAPATESAPASLSGTLQRCDDTWCVGTDRLDLGPHWYLTSVRAEHDYDGDGVLAPLVTELRGLEGARVRCEVTADRAVLTLQGLPYRDRRGPPPWAGGPLRAGDR